MIDPETSVHAPAEERVDRLPAGEPGSRRRPDPGGLVVPHEVEQPYRASDEAGLTRVRAAVHDIGGDEVVRGRRDGESDPSQARNPEDVRRDLIRDQLREALDRVENPREIEELSGLTRDELSAAIDEHPEELLSMLSDLLDPDKRGDDRPPDGLRERVTEAIEDSVDGKKPKKRKLSKEERSWIRRHPIWALIILVLATTYGPPLAAALVTLSFMGGGGKG